MTTKPQSNQITYDNGTVQDVLDTAKSLQNYTALRSYTGRATHVRITTPGIHGFFRKVPNTGQADNGGTVIVGVFVWERVFEGAVDVKWFGAACDGVTDDTVATQAALDAAAGSVLRIHGNLRLSPSAMRSLPGSGLIVSSNTDVEFIGGASLQLDAHGEYAHVLVIGSAQSDITIINPTIEGNNAFANGIVLSGLGGGDNSNCHVINGSVRNIRSELVVRSVADGGLYQREGGAAYIMETLGSGSMQGCEAIGCQFAIRYAPSATTNCNYTVSDFYAENCEAVLNTTPSSFDNNHYAESASYNLLMRASLILNGVVFKNCGASTDARTALSFTWVDSSAESGGRASGNYYPWAGIRRNSAGTYAGLNWEPSVFNVGDTEWSGSTTYTAGNKVKVTNDGTLGAVFCFGRAGSVTISNVRGYNTYATGTYPVIGSVFRGVMRGVSISDVMVDVQCDNLFEFGVCPSSTWDLQPYMFTDNVFADGIINLGGSAYIAESTLPYNGTWASEFTTVTVNYGMNVRNVHLKNVLTRAVFAHFVGDNLKTVAPAAAVDFDHTNILDVTIPGFGVSRRGTFSDFASLMTNTSSPGKRDVLTRLTTSFNGLAVSTKYASTDSAVVEELLNNSASYTIRAKNNIGASSDLVFDPTAQAIKTNRDNYFDLGTPTERMRRVYARELRMGDTGALTVNYGIGSPLGVVTAPVGSVYLRTDGSTGTTFYVKESGSGNTGWVSK